MRHLILLIAVFLTFGSTAADAQMHHGMKNNMNKNQMKEEPRQGGKMNGMMHGGMMHGNMGMMKKDMPMKKFMMHVNMMPMMTEILGLSDEQTNQMIDIQTEYKKKMVDFKADLKKNKLKLKKMIKNEVSSSMLKDQLTKCSGIKINMKVLAYETSQKMMNVLNEKQTEKWNNMMKSNEMMDDDMDDDMDHDD